MNDDEFERLTYDPRAEGIVEVWTALQDHLSLVKGHYEAVERNRRDHDVDDHDKICRRCKRAPRYQGDRLEAIEFFRGTDRESVEQILGIVQRACTRWEDIDGVKVGTPMRFPHLGLSKDNIALLTSSLVAALARKSRE